MRATLQTVALALLLGACATEFHPLDDYEPVPATSVVAAPEPLPNSDYPAAAVQRGQYLVGLLGCGACHTDGALIGEPRSDRLLAGSRIGLAHDNPLSVRRPGVVFPTNLTPDTTTGIGTLSDRELAMAIRSGAGRHGRASLRVMPVAAYASLNDEDLAALIAYLRSLPAVQHQVPAEVPTGRATREPYVHFGVYRSRSLMQN